MVTTWNEASYGDVSNDDIWGAIQESSTYPLVTTTSDSQKWFVPSKEEWSAFCAVYGLKYSNFKSFGLSYYYWSSSLSGTSIAYYTNLNSGTMGSEGILYTNPVRLSATF